MDGEKKKVDLRLPQRKGRPSSTGEWLSRPTVVVIMGLITGALLVLAVVAIAAWYEVNYAPLIPPPLMEHWQKKDATAPADWEKELADVPAVSPRFAKQPAPSSPSASPKDVGPASGKPLDPVALFANSRAAVATILTKDDLGFDAALGSGFFIAPELVGPRYRDFKFWQQSDGKHQHAYLVTNYHVIRSAATAKVRLDDGQRGFISDVVMENEDVDLAVVVVSYHQSSDSKPVASLGIADGPEPPVGQKVYAIGSPKGLEASLSEGIISGKREIADGICCLQTTAPISPGSSGGPLLDSTGRVVGVTSSGLRGGQNLNFAIPASQVLAFLKGPCNSRPLWRGVGIEREEWDSYISAECGMFVHTEEDVPLTDVEKTERTAGRLLFKACQQMDGKDYSGAMESLTAIVPSQCGEYEYLLYLTIGKCAVARAQKSEVAAYKAAGSNRGAFNLKMEDELQAIARSNKNEQLGEKCFAKAIELKPAFSPSYLHLAESLSRQGRFAEGLKVAEQLLQRVPRCAGAYKLRGGFYADLGHNLKAYSDFQTAAELGPSDPETYWELAQVCKKLNENAEEIVAYEAAIRLNSPNLSVCCFNMGACYKRMGKYEQALGCFEKAKSHGIPPALCDVEIAKCRAAMK